jgi:hypothetical protein
MDINQATRSILSFITQNDAELNQQNPALEALIHNAVHYLEHADQFNSIARQKVFLNEVLIPLEKATNGEYSFVLEHDISGGAGAGPPSVQISSSSGKFHALVIKRQAKPLEGYTVAQTLEVDGVPLQIAIAKDRVRSHVDLKKEFPDLHELKKECRDSATPVVYFLGSTRQFLESSHEKAQEILAQTQGLDRIFGQLEEMFGNNIVIGTGGWAGTREKSFGIPRMGYLRARAAGALTLATMPHIGKYDRHQNNNYEVFCGDEWGDDSATLAAVCDAAVIFRPFGTWTNIELANLQAQHKLIAVVDNPKSRVLHDGEAQREITTEYGSYQLFGSAADAAQYIGKELQKRGFKKAAPFNFTSKAGSTKAEAVLEHHVKPQSLDALKAAHIELLQNLGPLPDGSSERYLQDMRDATTANSLFLIVEQYIADLYHSRSSERT